MDSTDASKLATGYDDCATPILRALGIGEHESVRSLDIRMRGNGLVQVDVVRYVRRDQMGKLAEALTRYQLVPVGEVPAAPQYVSGEARPAWQTRWWLRSRPCTMQVADGQETPGQELYVPWWAWPLEGAHRLIFGSTRIAA